MARQRVRGARPNTPRWETDAEWHKRIGKAGVAKVEQWREDHRWHSHQLRHNAGTFLRKEFGLDAARVILGHRTPAITEIYAELDREKAVDIIGKVG